MVVVVVVVAGLLVDVVAGPGAIRIIEERALLDRFGPDSGMEKERRGGHACVRTRMTYLLAVARVGRGLGRPSIREPLSESRKS